jgi:hypothetical protein
VLNYTRAQRLVSEKHSSLLGPLVSSEQDSWLVRKITAVIFENKAKYVSNAFLEYDIGDELQK